MKRQSFLMLLLKGVGYIVLGNIMCLFMTMGLAMFGGNMFTDILSILCGTAIFYILIFTVAWKDGTAERSLVKNGRVDGPLKFRWLLIGFLMFVIAAAPTIILLVNKLLFPEADTLYLYRFISGSAFPFLMTFVPNVVTESEAWMPTTLRQIDLMSPMFPALMLIFYAIIPAITHLGYWAGFNDKLNSDKFMYK